MSIYFDTSISLSSTSCIPFDPTLSTFIFLFYRHNDIVYNHVYFYQVSLVLSLKLTSFICSFNFDIRSITFIFAFIGNRKICIDYLLLHVYSFFFFFLFFLINIGLIISLSVTFYGFCKIDLTLKEDTEHY